AVEDGAGVGHAAVLQGLQPGRKYERRTPFGTVSLRNHNMSDSSPKQGGEGAGGRDRDEFKAGSEEPQRENERFGKKGSLGRLRCNTNRLCRQGIGRRRLNRGPESAKNWRRNGTC